MEPVAGAALGWPAWFTVAVLAGMIVALVRDLARPDAIVLGSLGALLAAGVVTPEQAFAGFSNPAVLTVASLYVVAAGVQRTDALSVLDRYLFSSSDATPRILSRLMAPTAALSAMLNNTPIVAMLTPRVQQWAADRGIPASKLLIPLSYAAIAGGMVTLIGTSTNLVVSGLMQAEGYAPLGFFDVTWIGLPAVGLVLAYFLLGGHRLLPTRQTQGTAAEEGLQDFLFEMRVSRDSSLPGTTVEQAGLRALGNAFLVHLRRNGAVVQASPERTLRSDDVLTFTGSPEAMEHLRQRPDLRREVPALEADGDYETMPLYEAVVAASSSLVGKTLREVNFREKYGGVVLAIQRKDASIDGRLGRTPIQAGDLLLIEAKEGFEQKWNANRDEFYLVAPRSGSARQQRSGKAPLALGIALVMIGLAATGLVPIVTAAFIAALVMLITGCLRSQEAGEALNLQVLLVIAGALGLGQAVAETGLAAAAAGGVLALTMPLGTLAVLVALYLATNWLTEVITNNAAAVLMLPVALAAAPELAIEPNGVAVLVAVAASASFITPIGYQTNLMVMAPGGYRFSDYTRVGLPLSLLMMILAVTVIFLVWG